MKEQEIFQQFQRFQTIFKEVSSKNEYVKPVLKNTLLPNSPPPYNLTILKVRHLNNQSVSLKIQLFY